MGNLITDWTPDICSPVRREPLKAIYSRNAQIIILVEMAQTECGITMNNRNPANVFQLTPPRVHEIRLEAQAAPKQLHLLPSYPYDREEVVDVVIMIETSPDIFMIQKELLRFIDRNFNETLTYSWIDGGLGL
jgi:hypothetical protein